MKLELQKHPTDIDLQSYQYIQLKGLLKYDDKNIAIPSSKFGDTYRILFLLYIVYHCKKGLHDSNVEESMK